MKKILITGASGFVGTRLAGYFLSEQHRVIGTGTSKEHPLSREYENFLWVSADTTQEGDWQEHVRHSDVVINLAGRNIFRFWTKNYKQAIYDSRILTTRNLVNAMEAGRTQKFVTTSAVGIYGDAKDRVVMENSTPGQGFLAQVCTDWEAAAVKAREKDITVAIMRLGIVLGEKGALSLMLPAFKFFVGGPVGKGNQWFPWIHVRDLEAAVGMLVERTGLGGIFNFTGPGLVRQRQFARSLGQVLHRPAFMPAPAFAVKAVMGELGEALLQSQRALPGHLLDSGYSFLFPDIDSALDDILGK